MEDVEEKIRDDALEKRVPIWYCGECVEDFPCTTCLENKRGVDLLLGIGENK